MAEGIRYLTFSASQKAEGLKPLNVHAAGRQREAENLSSKKHYDMI